MNKDNEQREIKLRAWDGDKWHYFDMSKPWPWPMEIAHKYNELAFNGTPFYQFTGLYDKSGSEIYDKDTLSLWCQADPNDYEMKAEVFWDHDGYCWGIRCHHPSGRISTESLMEIAAEPEFIEVIGHIYSSEPIVK